MARPIEKEHQEPYACCLRESFQIERHTGTNSKGMEKRYLMQMELGIKKLGKQYLSQTK